jgi:endonuclease/exonuclease/phosphatase family metal-dependent hydrolase
MPDGRLVIGNVHLSHLPGGGALRAAQLRDVISAVSARAPAGAGLIAGDFNAPLESAELRPFLDGPWHLSNAFAGHLAIKHTHIGSYGQPMDLDHALLLPTPGKALHVQIRQACVVMNRPGKNGVEASDHAGLYLNVELRSA